MECGIWMASKPLGRPCMLKNHALELSLLFVPNSSLVEGAKCGAKLLMHLTSFLLFGPELLQSQSAYGAHKVLLTLTQHPRATPHSDAF